MIHSPPLIAVVEDDSSVRKALGRLLRSAGFRVESCVSGEDFLRALATRLPDCLLLDLHLPGMSGLAVQASLRKSRGTLPMIFVTAEAGLEARRQALQSGARAWLQKPVSPEALLNAIALALTTDY